MTEFVILTKYHGSALLAELVMERRRIRAKYRPLRLSPPPPKAPPPLPSHKIKPLQERLAEVDLLGNDLSYRDKRKMRNAILWSASSYGEFMETGDPPPRIAVPGKPTITEIQKFTAFHFNVSLDSLLGRVRPTYVVLPRQIAMYLSRLLTERSLHEIARMFRRRDHTTILHATRKVARMMVENWWFGQMVETLKKRLLQQVVYG